MSTLIPKRSRSKRPRSSHVVPEVISSAPSDPAPESTAKAKDSLKAKETALKDEELLKSTKALVRDAGELFSRNVTLSDGRIQAIRRQVEKAMPRLYDLSQDCSPSHTSSETSLIMRIAEDFLKKFPDTETPTRTGHSPSAETRLSPDTVTDIPASVSPPRAVLTQPAVPNPRMQQPGLVPRSSLKTSGTQTLARPQPIPSTVHPSATPSLSVLSTPSSYPETTILYNTPGRSRPPIWSGSYETVYTPSHLHEAVKHTTQHQKMVLFAVHELLRKRSSAVRRQPWYEPPIGLSPEEFLNAQDRHRRRPNFGGQFPQHLPPAHSPAGNPYPFHGNRSVAVGRSIPQSSSME